MLEIYACADHKRTHTRVCAHTLTLLFEVLAPLVVSIPEQKKAKQRECCCFASAGCWVTVAKRYLLLLTRLS